MATDLLPAIAAFARVAHHASFTRAAKELGVSPSALSQTVRALEARLGVRLLDRTTRRVGVTEIGQRFLDDASSGLATIEQALVSVHEQRDAPAGLLRINLPRGLGELLVLPHLAAFHAAYPDVVVELYCDNQFVDLVGNGFDAGFRLGESLARDVVAVPIGPPMRVAAVASPAYIERHGAPRDPAELLQHRCVAYRMLADRSLMRWELKQAGRVIEVEVTPSMISNDGELLLRMACAGLGVGMHFDRVAQPYFDRGELVPLLREYWVDYGPFHLYYPSRVHVPRKLRVFVDFMRDVYADV